MITIRSSRSPLGTISWHLKAIVLLLAGVIRPGKWPLVSCTTPTQVTAGASHVSKSKPFCPHVPGWSFDRVTILDLFLII